MAYVPDKKKSKTHVVSLISYMIISIIGFLMFLEPYAFTRFHPLQFIGISLVLVCSFYLLPFITKQLIRQRDFLDVDQDRKVTLDGGGAFKEILQEIRTLKLKQDKIDTGEIEKLAESVSTQLEEIKKEKTTPPASFTEYFLLISKQLVNKAADSDEKASILLTKGRTYTTLGIVLYIIAIVAWQIWAYIEGEFKEQFIYGIASFSLLFIFIEFLSAWYLRQFRYFMETSTYLMKIKAIFDRYMMAYYAVKELRPGEEIEKDVCLRLVDMLVSDIKWPDPYSLKKGDTSFAAEAMTSMAEMAKAIRLSQGNSKAQ